MQAVAPEAPEFGDVSDDDLRRVRAARRRFTRMVEKAVDTGDDRELTARVERFITRSDR
jgi:hypothetical protein